MNKNRVALLQKFIEEEPGNPFNRYALAMEFRAHEPDITLKLLLELMTGHPDYLPPYYQAGQLLAEMGQTEEALIVFRKGLSLAQQQGEPKAAQEIKGALVGIEADK